MIEPTKLALFLTVSGALIISPGPDMLYVITRGISQGRRAGILSALGVIGGTLIHTTAAAFGLTLILQSSALAFLLLKYVGAVYLIYLGFKSWRDQSAFTLEPGAAQASSSALVWQGVLSNVFNPKVALFFLAFLPQFVDQDSPGAAWQMISLGLTFAGLGLCFLLVVGYSAGAIGRWIARRPDYAQLLQRLTGGILMGLGIRLAFAEQR